MGGRAIPLCELTPLKPTRAEFHAWLEAQGLAHVARLNLEAAAPFVDRSLWPRLRAVGAKRRLSDLASVEGIARADWLGDDLRTALPNAVQETIELEVQNAAKAREQVGERLAVPSDARLRAVHARLLALRERQGTKIAPRLDSLLTQDTLEFDAALPGFRFHDVLPSENPLRNGGGFARAKVRLLLSDLRQEVTCTCGATECVHALAAIDTAILRLGLLEDRQLAALNKPAWERTLEALQKAYAAKRAEAPTIEAPREELEVRLSFEREEIFATAWLGDAPCSAGELVQRADSALIELLPPRGEPATRALLERLMTFPRVVLDDAPERVVKIETAQVGIAAEDRGESVLLGPAVDGAPMPPPLAERVRRAKPGELLFLWDTGPCLLTLLDVSSDVRDMLEVLHREGASFPPESHAALLESLSSWSERMPVAMPRSVMGQAVPSQRVMVLRLEAQRTGGIVEVELRVRALPDAPAMWPGIGKRDVYLRRGTDAFHAVRDLHAEDEEARGFARELGLTEPLPRSEWAFSLETADHVFALLEKCAHSPRAPQLEWVGVPLRSLGTVGPRALRVVLDEKMEWFGALGELSVFGERVELARLVDAVRRDSKFVRVTSSDYVELTEALKAHLEALAAHAVEPKPPGATALGGETARSLHFGAAVVESLRNLERAGATVEGDAAWLQLVKRAEAARELDPKLPKGFKAALRPYQLDAFRWLTRLAAWGAGGVLADEMGLGKTVQALAVLLDRARKGPALVVAPTSVALNWKDEAARFAPGLRVHMYGDATDREALLASLKPKDVLVISYGLLVRDAAELSKKRFATAVFDEAQQLKNASTQRFHAAKTIKAEFRFALSGTPLENHLGELWAIYALIFPALLGPWESFRGRHAVEIEKQIDPRAPAELARVLTPFLLRRTKAEVESELPPRTEIKVAVTLSADEWQLYEDTRLAALSDLETPKKQLREEQRRVQVLALITRLRLAAAHPRLLDQYSKVPSSKLERLFELIEELRASGQRMLIFSQFTSLLGLVEEELKKRGIAYLSLDGSTPVAQRRERTLAFQAGNTSVFLISVKAGGFGLNLTAATNVIHLDPWWNPAVEDQASDRAHRIGQQRPVTIYRLISKATVEEKMLVFHEKKRALISKVLEGHATAAKLSSDELISLIGSR
ncbi:MAG: DEAD/DEAH box helicase [Archangium sp.]|nr:DEAD/DEAH box helicase [Archangium sp.]